MKKAAAKKMPRTTAAAMARGFIVICWAMTEATLALVVSNNRAQVCFKAIGVLVIAKHALKATKLPRGRSNIYLPTSEATMSTTQSSTVRARP